MKLVHDQMPLGKRRYRQATVKDDSLRLCPCCKVQHETNAHLLQREKNPARPSALSKLKSDIRTQDIHPVRYLLSAGLIHWITTPDAPFDPIVSELPPHIQERIQAALSSQARIGWIMQQRDISASTGPVLQPWICTTLPLPTCEKAIQE